MASNLKLAEKQNFTFKMHFKRNIGFVLFTLFSFVSFASHDSVSHETAAVEAHSTENSHEQNHEQKFDAGEMIIHHITDAHEIHFFTLNEGTPAEKHFSIYLPVIIKDENGFHFFSASHFYHNKKNAEVNGKHVHYYEHDGFILSGEKIYKAEGEEKVTFNEKGEVANASVLDLSPTKSVVGLFITALILILLFGAAARNYRKNPNAAPSGVQGLLETLVIFIRDEVVIPSIGHKHASRFMPFCLTTFFFIWIANILGMIPFIGGFNIMGTLGVTIVLATIVFIMTTINGKPYYWTHILWPHGVPLPIKFILVPIEIIGIFMKPLVLMIRLTANMTAGHIIFLALTSLVFIFGQSSAVAGYGVGVGSLAFMIFMYFIELLVAFLQAYVFTLLAASYFGSALEEPHH
jgi:F-type H+-transporting ATPase subunit a